MGTVRGRLESGKAWEKKNYICGGRCEKTEKSEKKRKPEIRRDREKCEVSHFLFCFAVSREDRYS